VRPRAPIVRAGGAARTGSSIALAVAVTLALGWYRAAFAEPAAPGDSHPASLKDQALLLVDKAATLWGEASVEAGRRLRQVLGPIAPMFAGTAQRSGPTTMQEVCEGLTCQCGCGLTVANCNHPTCPFAVPLRTQIDGMIKTGMTTTAIVASFRGKYGEKILSAPTTEGFNMLAWTTPFVAVFAGAILILVAVGRRRPAVPAPDNPPGQSREFDPRLKELLERDLRERI
jgi:cytochrome c-type biogenesis protein CcmH/NrfF